jgi:lipoprotein-anchoring transpeptidase ErfK/SrfK
MQVAQSLSGSAVIRSKSMSRGGILAMTLAMFSLLLTAAMPLATSAQSTTTAWSAPSTVYIPETGQTLDQLFLDLWRNSGGAKSFGYPITKEITQSNGHVIQYLQYARFEYWPEGDANGNTVFTAEIGNELRPMALQRSIAGFASTKPKQDGTALETARATQAWLPAEASRINLVDGTSYFSEETQHSVQGDFNTFWQNTGGTDYLGNPLTEQYTLSGVTYQVFDRGQLSFTKDAGVTLVPVGKLLADKYKLDQKQTDQGDVPTYSEDLFIPPPTPEPVIAARTGQNADPNGEFWLDVNLSTQYMVVYRGNVSIMETYVSTGREGFETPTGTFHINSKVGTQTMEGVLGGEYYNVPDVPDVMYFTDMGHAIHGAYWHNNFGSVMSHGCINLPMDVADWLFNEASVGTRLEIHY